MTRQLERCQSGADDAMELCDAVGQQKCPQQSPIPIPTCHQVWYQLKNSHPIFSYKIIAIASDHRDNVDTISVTMPTH